MKQKRLDTLAVILPLGLMLLAGLFALLWPQGNFSEAERRYKADAPGTPNLSAWATDRETEQYISDRVPFRQALVALDAAAQVGTGRRTQLEAWPVAGALVEKPVTGDPAAARKRLEQFRQLAEGAGAEWFVLVPPTHGSLLRGRMNALLNAMYSEEDKLTAVLAEDPHCIPLSDCFAAAETEVFYRTDHHWTLDGAYLAYARFCEAAGREKQLLESYRLESFPGFRGTTASRSGISWGETDVLRCAEPADGVVFTYDGDGQAYSSLIFPEQAAGWDGYAVYMNGNHGRAVIENPKAPEGTLLVFKDSFANCLLPLLSANYRTVVAVDARYGDIRFPEAAAEVKPDQILFCYSLDSLVNDTAVARKAR